MQCNATCSAYYPTDSGTEIKYEELAVLGYFCVLLSVVTQVNSVTVT